MYVKEKPQICISGISKSYLLYKAPWHSIAGRFFGVGKKGGEKEVLKNITFSVDPGEAVGIIGKNGSGKSTLLKILAGIVRPDTGAVTVRGNLSALLELGAGFNGEYTGKENIYLNGTLKGRSRRETEKILHKIADFAEIGAYMEMPVKTYSDGMFVRLAFAAAVCENPEILIVDEALAVGDYRFQAKCFSYFRSLHKMGRTLLYVSHDIDSIRMLCDRVIWLEDGEIKLDGNVAEVTAAYMEAVTGGVQGVTHSMDGCIRRFGSHVGALKELSLGEETAALHQRVTVTLAVDIPADAELPFLSVSLAVKDRTGKDLGVMATWEQGLRFSKPGRHLLRFTFKNILNSGTYTLAAGLENRRCHPITYYDYAEGLGYFTSAAEQPFFGTVDLCGGIEEIEENL